MKNSFDKRKQRARDINDTCDTRCDESPLLFDRLDGGERVRVIEGCVHA